MFSLLDGKTPNFVDVTIDDKTPILIKNAGALSEINTLCKKMGWTQTQSIIYAMMFYSHHVNQQHGYSQVTVNNKVTYTKNGATI